MATRKKVSKAILDLKKKKTKYIIDVLDKKYNPSITKFEIQDLEEQLAKKNIENNYLKQRILWLESFMREKATGEK